VREGQSWQVDDAVTEVGRTSKDEVRDRKGHELMRTFNALDLVVLNGVGETAEFTSVQRNGSAVVDLIVVSSCLLAKCSKVKVWEEDCTVIGDHRLVTMDIQSTMKEKQAKRSATLEGWNRKSGMDYGILQQVSESGMRVWKEKLAGNTVEVGVGRRRMKKKKNFKWDSEIFQLVREKNAIRKKMVGKEGKQRERS
jgi:hypothetical protein